MSLNIEFKARQHLAFSVDDRRSCFERDEIHSMDLAALGIPFQPLPDYHDGAAQALETAKRYMETARGPYALLVKRQTFLPYSLPKTSSENE
jgi:hypothetical protein